MDKAIGMGVFMDYLGKRTDRMRVPVQLNHDPEMSGEIRARASRRRRSIGAQIIHLLAVGLTHDPEETVYERRVASTHSEAQLLTAVEVATPIPAQPRTVTHGQSRKKEALA